MNSKFRTYVFGNGQWAVVNHATMKIYASSAGFPVDRMNDELRENGVNAHPMYCTTESVYESVMSGTLESVVAAVELNAAWMMLLATEPVRMVSK